MASITLPARPGQQPNLRALNIFRDLPAVADLIELCFSGTMDGEGRRYVQDMRRAGRDSSFLDWANHAAESTSLPLSGYVWEESGKIVGNTSLVPFRYRRQRIYLIANVAVHPDFRRKGIARLLTEHALLHAREKKADAIWLHVRADNPGAVKLYADLGFVVRARRTTWQAAGEAGTSRTQSEIAIKGRHPSYWPIQQRWLSRLYPDLLAWHRGWSFNALRPGLWKWLYLLFVDMNIHQWAAVRGSRLEAVLAWIPSGRGDALFAAAGEESDPEALTLLLSNARHTLAHQQQLSLEFPAGEFDSAIQAAGFEPQRTLIWMQSGEATL
jgi:ribosomal protein S18 acetylase RimI-like enzyme